MGFWVRFNWNLTYICSMVNNCCSNHSVLTSVRKKLVLFLQEKPYWKKNSINLYWSFLDTDYPTDSIRYPTLNWLRVSTIRSCLTMVRALHVEYCLNIQCMLITRHEKNPQINLPIYCNWFIPALLILCCTKDLLW